MKIFLLCALAWWTVGGLVHLLIALRAWYPRVVTYSRKADAIGGCIRLVLAVVVTWVVFNG